MTMLAILKSIAQSITNGPATHRYPSVPAKKTPVTRGHLENEIDSCIFCGLCVMHCPADAITISKSDRTWKLDRFRCIICGCCVDYCPKDCLHIETDYSNPETGPVVITLTGKEKDVDKSENSSI